MKRSTYAGTLSRHQFESEPQVNIADTGSAAKLCSNHQKTTANLFDRPLGLCLHHTRQFVNPLHGYTMSFLTLSRQAKVPFLKQ